MVVLYILQCRYTMRSFLREEDGIVQRYIPCIAVMDVIFFNRINSDAYKWMPLTE